MLTQQRSAAALLLLLPLAACSGGSKPAAAPPPTPSPTPSKTAAAVPITAGRSGDIGKTHINFVTTVKALDVNEVSVLDDYANGWKAYEQAIISGDPAPLATWFRGGELTARQAAVRAVARAKQTQAGTVTLKVRIVHAFFDASSVHICYDGTALHLYDATGKEIAVPKKEQTFTMYHSLRKGPAHWVLVKDEDTDPGHC